MTTAIDPTVPPSGTGCVECDAVGGWWMHSAPLRGLRPHWLLRRVTGSSRFGALAGDRPSDHPVVRTG